MKWMIVWWVIHVGHSEAIHIERDFPNQQACEIYGGELTAHNEGIRWHCSIE
jgi:hypothetical protein